MAPGERLSRPAGNDMIRPLRVAATIRSPANTAANAPSPPGCTEPTSAPLEASHTKAEGSSEPVTRSWPSGLQSIDDSRAACSSMVRSTTRSRWRMRKTDRSDEAVAMREPSGETSRAMTMLRCRRARRTSAVGHPPLGHLPARVADQDGVASRTEVDRGGVGLLLVVGGQDLHLLPGG